MGRRVIVFATACLCRLEEASNLQAVKPLVKIFGRGEVAQRRLKRLMAHPVLHSPYVNLRVASEWHSSSGTSSDRTDRDPSRRAR